MTLRLHEKIRRAIDTTPGLTQRGLAERMGLNPAAVNRMLYGRRNIMADEVPLIEDYIGVKLELGTPRDYPQRSAAPRGFSDVPAMSYDEGLPPPPVPVFRAPSHGEVIDWAPRHPLQYAVRDAYALYVTDEDMQPRYYRGETVYVHPAKPVMSGSDCVVEMKNGDVLLRRLAQKSGDRLTVQQFNPSKLVEIPLDDVAGLYSIIGRA